MKTYGIFIATAILSATTGYAADPVRIASSGANVGASHVPRGGGGWALLLCQRFPRGRVRVTERGHRISDIGLREVSALEEKRGIQGHGLAAECVRKGRAESLFEDVHGEGDCGRRSNEVPGTESPSIQEWAGRRAQGSGIGLRGSHYMEAAGNAYY